MCIKKKCCVVNPDMNNEEKLKSDDGSSEMLFGLGVVFLLISPIICIASYMMFKFEGISPNFLWYICYFIVWIIILILMDNNTTYADDAIQEPFDEVMPR